MRFLHTSDWHVGKTLKGHDRLPEQREVLAEIVRIARERQVDAVSYRSPATSTASTRSSSSSARCSRCGTPVRR